MAALAAPLVVGRNARKQQKRAEQTAERQIQELSKAEEKKPMPVPPEPGQQRQEETRRQRRRRGRTSTLLSQLDDRVGV